MQTLPSILAIYSIWWHCAVGCEVSKNYIEDSLGFIEDSLGEDWDLDKKTT